MGKSELLEALREAGYGSYASQVGAGMASGVPFVFRVTGGKLFVRHAANHSEGPPGSLVAEFMSGETGASTIVATEKGAMFKPGTLRRRSFRVDDEDWADAAALGDPSEVTRTALLEYLDRRLPARARRRR